MWIVFRFFILSAFLVSCGLTASIDQLDQTTKSKDTTDSAYVLNPVVNVQMDPAHNVLTENPLLTFEYNESGNTYAISLFEYSIGTAILSQDILPWTSIGSNHQVQNTLLSLNIHTDYYINIRVRDIKDNLSSVVSRSWRTVGTVGSDARFATAPAWNGYVRRASPSTLCDGTEFNYYSCLHGGEKKTIPVTGENSCTDLTAVDSLGAFTWECVAGSPVSFISKELNDGKGLVDLITATEWKNIRIFISKNSVPVFASTPAKWWTTPILPLPDNSSGSVVQLNSDTIYTLASSRTTPGYRLGLKTSVVVFPEAELSTSAAVLLLPHEYAAGQFRYDRNWFEGSFKGVSMFQNSINARFLVFNNVLAQISIVENSPFTISHGLFRNYQNSPSVVENFAFSRSVIRDSIFKGDNFPPNPTGINNTFLNTYQFNFWGMNSSNNFFVNTTSTADFYAAVYERMTMNNYLGNSDEKSIFSFDYFTFSNIAAQIFNFGISSSTSVKFTGNLVYDTPAGGVASSTGINPDFSLSAPSNAVVKSGYQFMTQTVHPFIGVVSQDTKQGVTSSTPVPYASIQDFFKFDQPTRRWVNSADYYQTCATGMTCVIFDYAMKSTDTLVRNKSGDFTNENSAFPTNSTDPCPAEVHGNKALTNQHSVVNTYLQHAFEIVGDEIGDDNGLCESNESCIYSPNPGAYQGHGDYRSKTCAFQNGTISNVKMYAYPNNGY